MSPDKEMAMALYDVSHTCGHMQEHNITGTNVRGERERKAEWLAGRTCSECYRTGQATKRTETAAAHADLTNLPALTGSERQTAWAAKIRVDGIAGIVREVNDPPHGYNKAVAAVMTGHIAVLSGPALERLDAAGKTEVTALLIAAALRQTSSKWWIDNRDHVTGATIDSLEEAEHATIADLLGHGQGV